MFESPSCGSGSHQAGLTKAEVPVLVTDDEVIEQWQVEHVGGGTQSQREPHRPGSVGSPLEWLWTIITPVVPGGRHRVVWCGSSEW